MAAPDRITDLAARTMHPARPRLAEALAVAAEIWRESCGERSYAGDVLQSAAVSPDHAARVAPAVWEALAARDVIPSEWVESPARRFRAASGAVTAHPPTLAACVALASDPHGLATSEELAREVARRLAPWGHADAAEIVWCVRVRPYHAAGDVPRLHLDRVGAALAERAMLTADAHGAWRSVLTAHRRAHQWRGDPPGAAWVVAGYERDRVAWTCAAARGLASFARLPNPYEPLLGIWNSGYALDALGDGVLTLVAPEVAA